MAHEGGKMSFLLPGDIPGQLSETLQMLANWGPFIPVYAAAGAGGCIGCGTDLAEQLRDASLEHRQQPFWGRLPLELAFQ